jgi:hypothetical protein
MGLFSIYSQELFEVATTDFIAGNAETRNVLAHPLKDPWRVLVSSKGCCSSNYQILFCSTGIS